MKNCDFLVFMSCFRCSYRMRFFKNPYRDFEPSSAVVAIDEKFWADFVAKKMKEIVEHVACHPDNADGGLYTGSPGIGYALWYVARTAGERFLSTQERTTFMQQGLDYCESYFQNKHRGDADTSFLCGAAGVHVAAALLAHDLNKPDLCKQHVSAFQSLGRHLLPIDVLRHGSDEMLVGRAGYLAGALQLGRFVPDSMDHTTLKTIYDVIIQSGQKYSARNRSFSPLMYSYYNTEYLGAAHGLAGILQEILSARGVVRDINEPPSVRVAVDALLGLKQSDANYAPATDEVANPRPKKDALVHWCHGAPGVVYCMAMAYRRYHDINYVQAVFDAGNMVWERGLLRKGPGICHGVGGNGYVHLLCHRFATDPLVKQKHLYRAIKFCEFLLTDEFRTQANVPDAPWSLYEGWAGTLCFISDVIFNPDKAEFPFSDVFSY